MKIKGASLLEAIQAPANPFPGLRPFEFHESDLFFGRDGQVEKLIGKLTETRFLAVVGTSGSGKSSLVRAGLLPALVGGMMTPAGSNWRMAIMRPGNDPIGSLAQALNQPDVFGSDDSESVAIQNAVAEATLRRGSRGLVEAVRQNAMAENENLLVVVDQFEELFRFAREASRRTKDESDRYRNEAAAFVKLLLDAHSQHEANIYVVLTMRSDFLGDCAQFWDLPEAINESQYLIPRLTREQLREVIAGPVALGDGEITPRLVTQLLNDIGDNQDELPVLQHLLMRVWNECKEKRLEIDREDGGTSIPRPHSEVHQGSAIDLCCYEAVGGMSRSLSRHADEAFNELPDDRHREVAEKLFKALTEKGSDNREIRRPITLGEICAVADASSSEVITVIETFREPGRSFLMPPAGVALNSDSLVDISHESLIRGWVRLRDWVEEEARSARIYRRLAETAVLNKGDEASLWGGPDLQIALDWRKQSKPNLIWARRYHPEFELADSFLNQSVAARDAGIAGEEARRRKEIKRTRLTAMILGIAFVAALAMGSYAVAQSRKAEAAKNDALAQKQKADEAKDEALKARNDALAQKIEADEARNDALTKKKEADKAKDDALAQKIEADVAKDEADRAKNEVLAQSELRQAEALKGLALGALKEEKSDEALTHFTALNAHYGRLKNFSGQAYALANIAEIHKNRVPFAIFSSGLKSSAELEDYEDGDAQAYAATIKQYNTAYQMMALQTEDKDEETLIAELWNEANLAVSFYTQALEVNKLNREADQPAKEASALENLGDLKIDLIEFRSEMKKELQPEAKDEKAEAQEMARDIEQGIEYYTQASAAYKKAGMALEEAEVLRKIGNILAQMLDRKSASDQTAQTPTAEPDALSKYADGQERVISFYKLAGEAYQRANKPLQQASMLNRISDVYLSLPEEDYDRETNAILYMERARDIYRTQKNFQKDAALSEKMANLFGEESEKDNKLALYKEAFNAYRKAAAQKSRQQAEMSRKADEMLNKVGDLLYKPDNKQEVNAFFDEAIRGTGNDAVEKARILSLIGEFYKMKDVAEAIKYLGLKREMWQRAGKLFEEGNTLVEIGTIYKDTQNVAAATESYDAARAVYQRIDARAQDATGKLIRPQLTAYLMKLAAFYEEQDKQKAATVYEEALEAEMLAQTSYFLYSSISQILDNEGRLLLKMKTDEGQARAERLFQKVIEYYRKLKNADSEASALSAIGDLYKAAREKTDARAYYDRARAVYLANKKSDPMIDLLKKIGEIDIEATPGQSLLRYYLSAAESAGQAGDHVSQGVAFEAAGKFYRAEVGNKEKTIEYFEKARVAYQAAGMKMANIALLRAISYIYDEQGKKEKANELRKQADDLERTPN